MSVTAAWSRRWACWRPVRLFDPYIIKSFAYKIASKDFLGSFVWTRRSFLRIVFGDLRHHLWLQIKIVPQIFKEPCCTQCGLNEDTSSIFTLILMQQFPFIFFCFSLTDNNSDMHLYKSTFRKLSTIPRVQHFFHTAISLSSSAYRETNTWLHEKCMSE